MSLRGLVIAAKQCGRDAPQLLNRHFPLGGEGRIDEAKIEGKPSN